MRAIALSTAATGIVLAVVGRRPPSAMTVEATEPEDDVEAAALGDVVEVRIPAHNEATVVSGVIGDLGRQDSPGPFRVVVVDDRSDDGTGSAAAQAIDAAGLGGVARVVRRWHGAGSKGAALAHPDDGPNDSTIVLVLDADARVDRSFVARARRAVAATDAATARRQVLRPTRPTRGGIWLAAQSLEAACDDVVQRGRLALGGAAELRGNGMVLRRGLLDRLGGWPPDALTEDLELSTRIYLRTGRGVPRPLGFQVWEQAPSRPTAILTQRLRWAEGSVRRDLTIVLPALLDSAIPVRRRLDVAASASQDLMPWLALGLLLGALPIGRRRPLVELAMGYAAAAAVIALAADEPAQAAPERILWAIAAGVSWAAILPVAWLRVIRQPDRPAFRLTVHYPPDEFEAPFALAPVR